MPSGGRREGSGRKKKPLAEKLLDGNTGKRPIKTLKFGNGDELPVADPPEFLSLLSKNIDGIPTTSEIYKQTVEWLNGTGCGNLVSPTLIEEFSINKARWLECEYSNTKHGLLVKSSDGVAAISPFVKMSLEYLKATASAWSRIWQIVSDNSEKNFTKSNPNADIMAMLLDSKNPKK